MVDYEYPPDDLDYHQYIWADMYEPECSECEGKQEIPILENGKNVGWKPCWKCLPNRGFDQ